MMLPLFSYSRLIKINSSRYRQNDRAREFRESRLRHSNISKRLSLCIPDAYKNDLNVDTRHVLAIYKYSRRVVEYHKCSEEHLAFRNLPNINKNKRKNSQKPNKNQKNGLAHFIFANVVVLNDHLVKHMLWNWRTKP